MNKQEKIQDLRHFLARYGLPPDRPILPLGVPGADAALGGGLASGALHEVYAQDWAAGGFAACLAIRLARASFNGRGGPFFWVRPDYEALEYGALNAQGLVELGLDARNLFLIRTANAAEALAAAGDILACSHAGVVLLELCGQPKALDPVAGRRLNFIAAEKGVTILLLHEGAADEASAAQTRWRVTSAPSGDEEWGAPTYRAELLRNRLGPCGSWTMTWNPDDGLFRESGHAAHAPHPGALVAAAFDRPAEKERRFAF
jgi:protein ImuA